MIERPSLIAAFALLATAGSGLVGCGLKGSLYLPEDKSQEVSSQSPPRPGASETERKQRSTSDGTQSPSTTPAVPTDTTSAPSSTPPPSGN